MYTSDEEYQKRQRESAQEYIASIARRCASQKRRIKELDYFRGVYQAFGDWQTAIDVLEEQMVDGTYGRNRLQCTGVQADRRKAQSLRRAENAPFGGTRLRA